MLVDNVGTASNSITDEINTLSGEIEEVFKARLPGLDTDARIAQWIQSNGLDRQKGFLTKISKLVAFSIILKLLIVEYLRQTSESSYVKLSELADLNTISEQVNKEVGLELFPSSPLDQLVKTLPSCLRPSMEKIREFAESVRADRENIGAIYNSIVTQEERRRMGQFWTPDYIADFMVDWVIRTPQDKVFEPGTGPATFLIRAIRRLEELGQNKEEMHNNLFGVELAFIPYLMGTANLLSHLPKAKGNIAYRDFLLMGSQNDLYPKTSLGRYLFPSRVFLFDAIVFNPPYTRHHLLPSIYKNSLLPAFKRRFGVRVSRLSSLFVYFIFHALSFLEKEGRMAFITPTIVFESRTSDSLKDFLIKNADIKAIVSFADEINLFPGVDAAACITLLQKSLPKSAEVVLMEITKWPGKEQIIKALDSTVEGQQEWGSVRKISTAELVSNKNWTTLIRSGQLIESPKFVKLGELAHVVRGIATGANDFFTLTDEEVVKEGLERSLLKPVLTKTRYVQGYVFDSEDFTRLGEEGKKRWLLYCTEREYDTAVCSNVSKYIRKGEEAHLNERSLVKTRKRWYEMEQRQIPPILYTYLSRTRSRFILNKTGALALNTFLLVYPYPDISSDEISLKALLAVLNSRTTKNNLRQVGRSYGGDTLKLEPRQLDETRVLDPRKLTQDQRKKLAELFDQLCKKGRKQEEYIKRKIDQLTREYIA